MSEREENDGSTRRDLDAVQEPRGGSLVDIETDVMRLLDELERGGTPQVAS